MTVDLFDFGDGVPHRTHPSHHAVSRPRPTGDPSKRGSGATELASAVEQTLLHDLPIDLPDESSDRAQPTERNQAAGSNDTAPPDPAVKPRTSVRGFTLVVAIVGHALIGSLIAAGGHLLLGAVASVAIMGCSAALVATEALANQ